MKNCTVETNAQSCTCTYPCSRRGACCECIAYHRGRGELPACYFPKDVEKTYDRSVETFIAVYRERGAAW